MFSQSKLIKAKQKISKLKEKYSNISNFTKDDAEIIDFLPNTELLENNKPENNQITVKMFNETISPVSRSKSPRIEITSLVDDAKHDKGEEISSQILIDSQHSHFSFNLSPSDQSFCSKITNKTLKTESLVLSELSNQYEQICFLSSSSDEENTTRLHQENLSFQQTGRDLNNSSGIGLLQTSVQNIDGNFETKANDDLQKREESSSLLSEVQSDVNSTVFSGNEDSVKLYSQPVKFEDNNSESNVLKNNSKKINMDSENSYKTQSEEKQTLISDPETEANFSSQTQDISFTDEVGMKEIELSQLSKNKSKTKQKCVDYKSTEHNYVSNLKLDPKVKYNENKKTISLKRGDVKYSRYIDRSPVSKERRHVLQERMSSLPKKSRRKYPKRSNTILNHSTNLKPSKNRPTLRSCVLVNNDAFHEENELSTQRMSLVKHDGCGYEEVISQLLWNQLQMTRHFIHSHHQMYLTCCQAVKILSEKYNSCHNA